MQQKPPYSNLIPSADEKDGGYWFKTGFECRRWTPLIVSCYRLGWTRLGWAGPGWTRPGLTRPGLLPTASIEERLSHMSCDWFEVNIWIIPMEQTSLPSVEDGLRPMVGTCDQLAVNIWILQ